MSIERSHGEFPSDETLAAFVDGRLDRDTRQRVVEHVADCDDCRDVVVFNQRFAQNERGGTIRPFPKRRPLLIAIAAAALLAVIAVAAYRVLLDRRTSARIAQLAEAAPPYRPFDGRVALMPYRPERPTYRGAEESSDDSASWRAQALAAEIRNDAEARRTVKNLHALGIANLTVGKATDAVTALESAIKKEQGAASIGAAIASSRDDMLLSDLAAAYIASGDAPSAFRCADRSWCLHQSAPAAWNRAVAATTLGMRDRAVAAWKDYLAIDGSSPWAAEARTRLQRL